MDYDKLCDYLDLIEYLIPNLEDLRDMSRDLEVRSMLDDLKKERQRVQELIGEEEERQREALCREYERNAL